MKSNVVNPRPKKGISGFAMEVSPKQEFLDKAIASGAHCDPRNCWQHLEVASILQAWDPNGNHHVRVDAGHVKFNLWGWRYTADTPRTVKRGFMLFDLKRYEEIRIRPYKLRCRRSTKILPYTKERQAQINSARAVRVKEGRDNYTRPPVSLRKRVEGFSSIV